MPARPRPNHTAALVAHLTATYGQRATCRASTHHASHTGEIRVYLTVTRKEAPA
jgi:hypothetical protein